MFRNRAPGAIRRSARRTSVAIAPDAPRPVSILFLEDVNVRIALSDPAHAGHGRARQWLSGRRDDGLATCALTENGFLRIFGHPAYPGGPGSPSKALKDLHAYRLRSGHRFLPCDLSMDDTSVFPDLAETSPRQLTDLYLLALADRHGARFVTFDLGIRVDLVTDGTRFVEWIHGEP